MLHHIGNNIDHAVNIVLRNTVVMTIADQYWIPDINLMTKIHFSHEHRAEMYILQLLLLFNGL